MRFKNYLEESILLEAKEDPLVKYALENYPKLFKMSNGGIGTERDPYYYISTGQKGVYYTLRMRYKETRWAKTSRGEAYASGATERDYLVLNLGPNPEKAVERLVKEKPKHRYYIIYISAIQLRPKMKDRPSDEVKFGKYSGMSIYQVAEEDPDYVFWIWKQKGMETKYKTFWPHVLSVAENNPKVSQLINQWEMEQQAAEKEKEEKAKREDKENAKLMKSEWIGQNGEKIKGLQITVLRKHEFEGRFGMSAVTIMKDSKGNMIKHFGKNNLDKGDKKKIDFTVKGHETEEVNQWNKVPYRVTLVTRVKGK